MKIVKGNNAHLIYDYSGFYTIGDFYHDGGESPIGTYDLDDRIVKAVIAIFNYYGNNNKLKINSAYRTVKHNKEVGGVYNSLHLKGLAVDFYFERNNAKNLIEFKKDFTAQTSLYKTLKEIGVGEIQFHDTFIHIGIKDNRGLILPVNEFVNNNLIDSTKKEQIAFSKIPVSKDYYEYYHQDSSVATIDDLFDVQNSIVAVGGMTKKQLLEFKNSDKKSNLDRIWELYTESEKYEFSSEYKSLTTKMASVANSNDPDEIKMYSDYEKKRRLIKPNYENINYKIKVGTVFSIPKNKTNLEVLTAIGKDLFMKQQDLKTFLYDEFQKIANDPTYIQTQKLNIYNSSYSVNYLHIAFSVWIYLRSEDKILNISPFVKSVDTFVGEGGGTFSISLNEINGIDDVKKYSETYYTYIQKTEQNKYNLSFFEKNIQQNDIVFIRYEKLDIEGNNDLRSVDKLFIDKSDIPNRIYDMIGLVDANNEPYSASTNIPFFNLSGRDFTKMLIEDGSYFFPFALVSGGKGFFLNYNSKDTVFKRLFSGSGEFSTEFTSLFRSIRDSLGFIFNQLTNTGVLSTNSDLFDSYGDRISKYYKLSGDTGQLPSTAEVNGVWKIIKLVVDHQLDERRLNNGELSCPDGSIIDLVNRICQDPFVEFWGDTLGDQFVFMARQPPITKDQIVDYFNSNLPITITSDQVNDIDLSWDDTYYTWYKLNVMSSLWGSLDLISAIAMPLVYFEEYANLFGMHKREIADNYLASDILNGSQLKKNVDVFRESYANDIGFLIESSAILPFTRKGTISIIGGDRRIKKGMWVLFEPTDEICFVKSVSNSVQASDDDLNRITTIEVERCMLRKYVLGGSGKYNTGSNDGLMTENNYFDIINVGTIKELIKVNIVDAAESKESKSGSGYQLINKELFDFFSKRKQWD